ncbi:hypothetical protein PIB30_085057 [Stylosanthes scabra]|uniref:Uncharacterized protein n=1 Tax=Stylosanthes scabra TaxID=79078 RepID=A0ABU6UVG2_9FABA|nr:hypothetical protein [Stylosanthes scabra]
MTPPRFLGASWLSSPRKWIFAIYRIRRRLQPSLSFHPTHISLNRSHRMEPNHMRHSSILYYAMRNFWAPISFMEELTPPAFMGEDNRLIGFVSPIY